MAVPIEEGVLNALRGDVSETTKLPRPLIIKIYVSSLKNEFQEERRTILEVIGPELQSIYDDRQIEIEIVDMHFGTGPPDTPSILEIDPYLIDDYLSEIECCFKVSKSVFFMAIIGEQIGRMCLPPYISGSLFTVILNNCDSKENNILSKWYKKNKTKKPKNHHDNEDLFYLSEEYRNLGKEEWQEERLKLTKLLEKIINNLISLDHNLKEQFKQLKRTQLEIEIEKALEFSTEKIIAVFREWSSEIKDDLTDPTSKQRLRQLKDKITFSLPPENYTTLIISGDSSNHQIDSELDEHERYLNNFKNKIFEKMRNIIENHLISDPDIVKGRKKTVQEIFHEHSTHLRLINEHLNSNSLISSDLPNRIRTKIQICYKNGSRHAPLFLYGSHGTGKSTLIAELYSQSKNWFGEFIKTNRIIRFASATPRSAYNLELLRIICQQISIIFNIPEGYLPKDASFDPTYINNWFQNLFKRCEDLNNEVLFLFIDDLHKLNPLDCDIVAALSWLPISLPRNVYIICTTAVPIEQLKFTAIQKDRFKSSEYLFDLSLDLNKIELKSENNYKSIINDDNNTNEKNNDDNNYCTRTFIDQIINEFNYLEQKYGKKGFGKLASYLTCSVYGLTETELLELLMPTDSPDTMIETKDGFFNFSTFQKIFNEMKYLLVREKIMSGKILIEWKHQFCAEITKTRYMDSNITRIMHTEISNMFFNQDMNESDDGSSEKTTDGNSTQSLQKIKTTTSVCNPSGAEVSYSVRHVEESWHHLMRSEDTDKFKQIAICNFDFLLASVQTVSVSYLRCLIEHVRCYILDRDIELIYYTIRKSSDVLTRDPMQLGGQLISWLRPITEHDENDNSLLSITVRSATAWCDGYTVPLLVPLTGWLPAPLPSQIRTMTVSGTGPIRCIVLAPSKQYLLIATKSGDIQLWHIMSNCLTHTFKEHTAAVTCMVVPPNSNFVIAGSEDKTLTVWDCDNRTMKWCQKEHTAIINCVESAINNTLAISGSDDCSIIISNIQTGKVVRKIDHHRGSVTSVKVCSTSDVLVSSSRDTTICLWSLDNYSLLNCIQMSNSILKMEISCDDVFVLTHCEDNDLYLRTLATGSELHSIKGHKSQIRSMTIAKDSHRAIVGYDDTRALIYDIHSGKLVRSLPPNPGPVTALYVMPNDDFLITAGGNKITFYSFRNEEIFVNAYSYHRKKRSFKQKQMLQRQQHTANLPPVTTFDISKDSQLAAVASGKCLHIMQINTVEHQITFDGHTGIVTCCAFSPNNEFIATGSEDKTAIIWSLSSGLIVTAFKNHKATITSIVVLMDSRRVISADKEGILYVWLADSAALMQTIQGPHKYLSVTNNMKFAVCSNGDNSLKIWSLTREDEKYTVSHSDDITCFVITADSLYVITGSKDMSLKVWQATGGKLAQVLVGHNDSVTCVAVSVTNKTQVISGSKDCNLIIWDIHTGEEIHTLAGHLAQVTCVKVSADGTTAISGSDDKTLIVWETKRGLALTSLQMHVPFVRFDVSLECSRILVQLVDTYNMPVICLHNTPAGYVKLPTYSAPARDVEDLRPIASKRQKKRLLKKEVSLDTYTWQKKYGHLTSSVMMAQVDERLKRRFSVSASMEEISKIAEMKSLSSQTGLGPEQAAIAQSQHFDQLEALWNKRSPPRRKHTSLSRQSSLAEDRIESSDEDEFQEERTDTR